MVLTRSYAGSLMTIRRMGCTNGYTHERWQEYAVSPHWCNPLCPQIPQQSPPNKVPRLRRDYVAANLRSKLADRRRIKRSRIPLACFEDPSRPGKCLNWVPVKRYGQRRLLHELPSSSERHAQLSAASLA
jgi:hypothetical protein